MSELMSISNTFESKYAADFLNGVLDEDTCEWCKHPEELLYRKHLCRHCYNISREIAKFELKVKKYEQADLPIPFILEYNLGVAKRMAQSAKREGSRYGDIHKRKIDGLDLEHEFSFLGESFIKQNLFHGHANIFDYCLSSSQKAFIFYNLSKLSRKYMRRNRRRNAYRPDET